MTLNHENIKRYYKLISELLDLSASTFSNYGCDDFPLDKIIPNVEDRRDLVKSMHEKNGDIDEYNPDGNYNHMPDYWLMRYFSNLLKEEGE